MVYLSIIQGIMGVQFDKYLQRFHVETKKNGEYVLLRDGWNAQLVPESIVLWGLVLWERSWYTVLVYKLEFYGHIEARKIFYPV